MSEETKAESGGVLGKIAGAAGAVAILGLGVLAVTSTGAAADPIDVVPVKVKTDFSTARKEDLTTLRAALTTAMAAKETASQAWKEADEAMSRPTAPAGSTPRGAALAKARIIAKFALEEAILAEQAAKDALSAKQTALKAADKALDEEFCKAQTAADAAVVAACLRRGITVPGAVER